MTNIQSTRTCPLEVWLATALVSLSLLACGSSAKSDANIAAARGGSPAAGAPSSAGAAAIPAAGATASNGGSAGSGGDSLAGNGGTSADSAVAGASADSGGAGSGGAPGSAGTVNAGGSAGVTDRYPLLKVLPLFSAPDVPVRGAQESPPSARGFTPPATLPVRMGNGIGQHPMLYVGENYNRITLINEGKVAWTYDTTPGYELDDIWMLSNGNVLYSHMTFIEEITPKKEVVWHYQPTTGEIHACQPIGLDRVLFVENALPMARVRIYNKQTKSFEVDHLLDAGTDQHGQFRRFRMTGAGTYLGSFMTLGKVVEYDKDFKVIWTYTTPRPWSGVRLQNGNTLILDESQQTCKEVNSAQQIVWQLKSSDVPVPAGAAFGASQTCERLYTGNTVMFGHSSSTGNAQAVELTAAKAVTWVLQDWIHLGDATSAQFLDEPGFPETPGDTNH